MSSLLQRIGAFFLEPADDGGTSPRAEPGSVPPQPVPNAAAADGRSTTLGFAASSAVRSGPGGAPPPPARPDATATPSACGNAALAGFAPPSAGRADATGFVAPSADAGDQPSAAVVAGHGFAVVLGAPADAVPVAAACAGELRVRARAAGAVVCVWGGGEPPAGATTPAVRRLAARLAAHGLAATASGRLAWIALDPSPADAASQVQRAKGVADSPIVLAVAGPRPDAFEPLLAEADFTLVALPADTEAPLRALALASLPSRASLAVPPVPPGPPRWAAMAGLARMRSLEPVPR